MRSNNETGFLESQAAQFGHSDEEADPRMLYRIDCVEGTSFQPSPNVPRPDNLLELLNPGAGLGARDELYCAASVGLNPIRDRQGLGVIAARVKNRNFVARACGNLGDCLAGRSNSAIADRSVNIWRDQAKPKPKRGQRGVSSRHVHQAAVRSNALSRERGAG